MRSRRHPHAFLLLAALACPVWSWAGDVKIDHAWVRATAPGQKVAGAFMAANVVRGRARNNAVTRALLFDTAPNHFHD